VVSDFVTRHGLGFPILRDPEAHTAAAYRTTGYPETFVVGRDGTVLRIFIGPAQRDTPEALGYFRSLLPRRAADQRSTSPAR
jgi:cytochrome c biogenesis protein CcmG/thiol:disulfide interchange protein DsbE